MTAKGHILANYLKNEGTQLWSHAWSDAIANRLAAYALNCIDFNTGKVGLAFNDLDSTIERSKLVPADDDIFDAVARSLLSGNAIFNKRLKQHSLGAESAIKMCVILKGDVVPNIVNSPDSVAVIQSLPLSRVWRAMGNKVASIVYHAESSSQPDPDWLLLNRLLIASYFQACNFDKASLVRGDLNNLANTFHGPRGSLLRIVEIVSSEGIRDPLPAQLVAPKVNHALNISLTPIDDAVSLEYSAFKDGRGLFHRHLPIADPVTAKIPHHLLSVMTPARIRNARDAMHSQHEAAIITYSALSALEHLMRCWAQHINIKHLKSNGEPKALLMWSKSLGCSSTLQAKLEDMYSSSGSNIRNRIMHGGLLECQSTYMEVLLNGGHVPGVTKTSSASVLNPLNIVELCMDALAQADREAIPLGLAETDQSWVHNLELSPVEIQFGHSLCADLLDKETALEWQAYISKFISSSMPSVSIFSKLAFLGWFKKFSTVDSLQFQMCWGVMFEAFFRLAVHLHGVEVLRRSPKGNNERMFQYKMLTPWEGGLCSEEIVDRIISNISPADRPIAKRTLVLATKARNALSHGAITTWNEHVHLGMGHLFAKSIQALVSSIINHMTEESAYYRWRSRSANQATSDIDDWLWAERTTLNEIFLRSI